MTKSNKTLLCCLLTCVMVLACALTILPIATPTTANAAEFRKATNIAIGDKIVIVSETADKELARVNTDKSNHYGEGDGNAKAPTGIMIFEVEAGFSEGTYSLKNDGKYLFWSSGNSLDVNETKSAKSSWTITFDKDGM